MQDSRSLLLPSNINMIREQLDALSVHAKTLAEFSIKEAFLKEATRGEKMSLQLGALWFDYSHQKITSETIVLLSDYAEKCDLSKQINGLLDGECVNPTENRAALHTALRDKNTQTHLKDPIKQTHAKLQAFAKEVGEKDYTDVIMIGIGGSHLGPLFTTTALKDFAVNSLKFHFISTIDPLPIHDLLPALVPEKTLLIIASKTFKTLETMTNASVVLKWLQKTCPEHYLKQVVAVTANEKEAIKFGVSKQAIFPMWDEIGGRYSIWSAIGLPLVLQIGWEKFCEFLNGAHEVDLHFKNAAFANNIPVLMGMVAFWNAHYLKTSAEAVIPYGARLTYFISYLQQLSMESLGKSVTLTGEPISHQTGQIIFGQEGCEGQHAYHQLLHQGSLIIPADFILFLNAHEKSLQSQHEMLVASALSQADALTNGNHDESLPPHQKIPGNKPYNLLCFNELTPHTLGMLIALYEHKTFVQSVLLNINAFDQFGVELGKKLLPDILSQLNNNTSAPHTGMAHVLNHLKKTRNTA